MISQVKEGRKIQRSKRCEKNKDDDNIPKTLTDKNHQASSQKFRKLNSSFLVYFVLSIFLHSITNHILSSTDSFGVSQLFSVARHVGRLKLRSKPAQLYVRLRIILLSQKTYYVTSGIIRYSVVMFVCLHFIPYWIPECSIRLKSFTLCERIYI